MDTLGKRLRFARDSKGYTLETIGIACGEKTPQAIAKWENDKATPNPHDLWTFVALTDVNFKWLMTGIGRPFGRQSGVKHAEPRGRVVPNVAWQNIPEFLKERHFHTEPFVRSAFPCGERSFATMVEDEANSPDIPAGSSVIVDPDVRPKPGDFVLAIIEGAPLVRKYRKRDDHIELAPANEDWDKFKADIDDTQWLIGTVSEVARSLLKP